MKITEELKDARYELAMETIVNLRKQIGLQDSIIEDQEEFIRGLI